MGYSLPINRKQCWATSSPTYEQMQISNRTMLVLTAIFRLNFNFRPWFFNQGHKVSVFRKSSFPSRVISRLSRYIPMEEPPISTWRLNLYLKVVLFLKAINKFKKIDSGYMVKFRRPTFPTYQFDRTIFFQQTNHVVFLNQR